MRCFRYLRDGFCALVWLGNLALAVSAYRQGQPSSPSDYLVISIALAAYAAADFVRCVRR